MDNFIKKDIKEFEIKPFKMLADEWMLITSAKKNGSVNTMTASWGGFGIMWNKFVCNVVLRPQRFTKEFVDESLEFSLCFFDSSYKKDMAYLGKVSGRDEDKLSKTSLTVDFHNSIPFFAESNLVIFCKVLLRQTLTEESFIEKTLLEQFYPENDLHDLYFAEITEIFEK